MPTTSILLGIIMVITGVAGVIVANADGKPSPTAFIPVAIGGLIIIFGLVAKSKDNLRKHLMHVALLLALIGAGGMIGRWVSAGTFTKPDFALTNALIVQLSFVTACLLYIIFGIKSFIDARSNPKI